MTTMTKTGRNDPCPCGSGKKYKRCCQEKDEAERSASRAAAQAAQQAALQAQQLARQARYEAAEKAFIEKTWELDVYCELADASNAVIKMVRAGRLDEAEAAARDLLVRYPEVHDGYDRLGMVYESMRRAAITNVPSSVIGRSSTLSARVRISMSRASNKPSTA